MRSARVDVLAYRGTPEVLAELFGVKVRAIAKHLKTSLNPASQTEPQPFPKWK